MKLHAWTSADVTQDNNMNTLRFIAQSFYKYKNNNQANYYVGEHLNEKNLTSHINKHTNVNNIEYLSRCNEK